MSPAALSVLGFFGTVGTILWAVWWGAEASTDKGEHRARDLRMAWLTPIWPLILIALGISAIPALLTWIAEVWQAAWSKPEEPEVEVVEGGWKFHGIYTEAAMMELREKIATGEPTVLREDPKPGRWEQPR